MEKALEILKDLCLVLTFNSYWKPRVDEAIAELEELIKPKSCYLCNDKSSCYTYKTLDEDATYWVSCPEFKPKENK